jgi:hypothetical protein
MASKLGMECKMFVGNNLLSNSVGPDDITWTEQSNVRDLTQNLEKAEADVTTRANNGFRATRGTLKEGTLEFEMVWDTEDSGFTAIRNAWLDNTEISIAALDGDINDSDESVEGLMSNFTVTNFSRSEALEEAVIMTVTLKVSSHTRWYSSEDES